MARVSLFAVLAAMALAGSALAVEPDAPMATAGGTGAVPAAEAVAARAAPQAPAATAPSPPLSTAEQIDAYLRTSPAAEDLRLEDEGRERVNDGRVHGEVSVGIGTGGYRSAHVRADVPLGARGRLSIAVGESRGRGLIGRCSEYGPGYGRYAGAPVVLDSSALALECGLPFGGGPVQR